LIIDSKVSLVDFEKYFNAETDEERQRFSKRHLQSIETHIKQLSKKDYQNLYGINSPDYVLMFLAYESAVVLAVKENPEIFQQALDKNIVLVSGSTLLATLKTVSYIWKQENQKTYVLEIAKQGGMLYDKFVLFVEDLKKIGSGIDQTNAAFESAMNKLTKSVKKGDTLVGRAEKIRELGARVSKKLPQDILDKAEINQEHITDGS
jgi:DNA recombination protein RmuC